MSKAVVRSGFDTYANANKPAKTFGGAKFLKLRAGVHEAFLYFRTPVPAGAVITKATLRVSARGASSGARTLSLRRVTSSWKAGRVNWNRRPSVGGPETFRSIGALSDGDVIEFDVTAYVQAWTSGTPNYGMRLTTSSSTVHRIIGLDGGRKPSLEIEWSDHPQEPTSLSPSDAVVATTHPTLQFDYIDVGGDTSLAAVQVQVDPVGDGAAPDWDSGVVETTAVELDLSETSFPGFSSAPQLWRVRVQDGAGLWSPWSAWSGEVVQRPRTPATFLNPAGGVVYETTPPIIWDPNGDQVQYRVMLYAAADMSRVLHDSGRLSGDDVAYTVPATVLTDDEDYVVRVRTWDSLDRVATPGDPAYAEAETSFTVEVAPEVAGPDTFTASAGATTPDVVLKWTRSTAPDSWTIYRDGRAVVADLEPEDALDADGGAGAYVYHDRGAAPQVPHVYTVRAVVNGRMSAPSLVREATPVPEGIWLYDPDSDDRVTLWGDEEGTWSTEDDASVYTPVGSSRPVRIVSSMRGLEGSLSGYLMEGFGLSFEEQERSLYRLKGKPSTTLRLAVTDLNIPVVVGNIVVAPRPVSRAGRRVKAVSFDFWQVGELPFRQPI